MNWIRGMFSQRKKDSLKQKELEPSNPEVNNKNVRISADNPITKLEEDALGRIKPASSFVKQVLALDSTEGVVVGVLGPWGSGKTSFVNLSKAYFKESDLTVVEFNPWMFSGADQLVQFFFIELAAQLKLRTNLNEIGTLVGEYGDTLSGLGWLPFVGDGFKLGGAATKLISNILKRKKEGVRPLQNKLRDTLKKLDKPIIVVLDDIDRLSTLEIRDVFKLVRLTANFPNIIYLLAFDRNRVEQALGEQGISGRDYLEKILQIGIDLPVVPNNVMNAQIFKAIDSAIEDIENQGHFDPEIWPDVFMEVIKPLIKNMRDVRRYALAIQGAVRELEGQVALVDVLALEAIRVFMPDVFHNLHTSLEGLTTTTNGYGYGGEQPHLKEQVEHLVNIDVEHAECVRNLISRLFPGGARHLGGMNYSAESKNRWLLERRVAHEDILRYYLERVVGEQLQAVSDAEYAWARITDKTAFESYLQELPKDKVHDVISLLEAYEDKFSVEHVVPATVVLLNILPQLPERQGGVFDFDSGLIVGRVVYRLVRALKEPELIEAAVKTILPQVQSFSSKEKLIGIVGYRENAGHKLISEAAAKVLEAEWRAEVRAATPQQLADDVDLLWTLFRVTRDAEDGEVKIVMPENPEVTFALLKSARSEVKTQTMGSRAVRRKPRLAWDILVELCGSEDILHSRIEALRVSPPDKIGDLLELADKYLNGWRPNDFGDD